MRQLRPRLFSVGSEVKGAAAVVVFVGSWVMRLRKELPTGASVVWDHGGIPMRGRNGFGGPSVTLR